MADVPIMIQLRAEAGLNPVRGIAITYRVHGVELDLKGTMTGKGEIERRQPVYRTDEGKIYIWGNTVEEVTDLGARMAGDDQKADGETEEPRAHVPESRWQFVHSPRRKLGSGERDAEERHRDREHTVAQEDHPVQQPGRTPWLGNIVVGRRMHRVSGRGGAASALIHGGPGRPCRAELDGRTKPPR